MTETLHANIIRTALPGASMRECPGGFIAYVGRRLDDHRCTVIYLHRNTDKLIHDIAWKQTRAFVIWTATLVGSCDGPATDAACINERGIAPPEEGE